MERREREVGVRMRKDKGGETRVRVKRRERRVEVSGNEDRDRMGENRKS